MSGILQLITGAAEIAAGVADEIVARGADPNGYMLIAAGVGTTISGIGALISSDPMKSRAITERNSITPWRYGYGRTAPKTDTVYIHQWGTKGQMVDMVIVVYDEHIESIDEVLFDQQRVQINTRYGPTSAKAGFTIPNTAPGSGTSFTPAQQNNIFATSITQFNDVVTIKLPEDIPFLTAGDPLVVKGTGGNTFSAIFPVAQILGRGGAFGALSLTLLNGGEMPTSVQVSTKWVDYGNTVYFEWLPGNQLLGQTFVGMTAGTPWLGMGSLVTPLSPLNAGTDDNFPAQANPWTPQCSGQGKALIFLRFTLQPKYYPSGLPLVSFRCHGKNDIFDPRLGPLSGVKNVSMSAPGSGYTVPALYGAYDVLTLVQSGASGGQVAITGVDGSGAITSLRVVSPGIGYSLGVATVTGGHGSGATFEVTVLTGATGTVHSASISQSGTGGGYQIGDVLTILQPGSTNDATVTVTSVATNNGNNITGISFTSGGTGGYFSSGFVNTTGGSGSGAVLAIRAGAVVYTENPVLCIADFMAAGRPQ